MNIKLVMLDNHKFLILFKNLAPN